jgi:hypothetical protein
VTSTLVKGKGAPTATTPDKTGADESDELPSQATRAAANETASTVPRFMKEIGCFTVLTPDKNNFSNLEEMDLAVNEGR